MSRQLLIICFLLASLQTFAQDTAKSSGNVKHKELRNSVLLCFNYTRQYPLGSLSERFGGNNAVGFTGAYKFGNNFQVQAGINTIFGSKIKENGIFDTMIGSSGYLIDINGQFAEIKQYQRGYNWHLDFGKIIPVNKFEKNSGILMTAGAGFMQHYIKYQFQRTVLPQIEGEYAKGYDRLTNGFMLRGFVGYQRIDPESMFNFLGGIEYLHGFTQSRRSYNYDTRQADTQKRNDIQLGIKVGFMISLSGRQAGTKKGEEGHFFD